MIGNLSQYQSRGGHQLVLLQPFLVLFHQLIYMMATTYNFAVLKFKSREDCCTKF